MDKFTPADGIEKATRFVCQHAGIRSYTVDDPVRLASKSREQRRNRSEKENYSSTYVRTFVVATIIWLVLCIVFFVAFYYRRSFVDLFALLPITGIYFVFVRGYVARKRAHMNFDKNA